MREPARGEHAITTLGAPVPQLLVVVMADIRMQKSRDCIGIAQEHVCHGAQQMGAKSLSPHRRRRCQGADANAALAETKLVAIDDKGGDRPLIDKQQIPNTGLVFFTALAACEIFSWRKCTTLGIKPHPVDGIQLMVAGFSYLHQLFTPL